MRRLLALLLLLGLAVAQGLEALWKPVEVPGGVCSDGSPYRFYVSPGDPKKVVIDFQGGGACWDAATCGPQSPTYRKRVGLGLLLFGAFLGILARPRPLGVLLLLLGLGLGYGRLGRG